MNSTNQINKNRIIYIDILNILAIIAVVALHCNGIVHSSPKIRAWNTSLIVECIFYWAVPVFFMITGATLMNYRKKYDTKTFFKKRLLKILIPFAFWATFMLVWKIYTKQLPSNTVTGVRTFFNTIFLNREEGTYYFLFEILGIYLTMPLLSNLTDEKYRKSLWFTVILYFLFNATVGTVLPLLDIKYNNALSVQIGKYIIFVLLGYLLSTEDLCRKKRLIIYIGAVLGLIYRYVTTFILSNNAGVVVKTTWGYNSFHSILLAVAVFVFIRNIPWNNIFKNEKIPVLLSKISGCSFGVYLMHKIVIYYQVKLLHISLYSWQFRTIGIITTYIISLAAVYLLKKIPLVKKLVP